MNAERLSYGYIKQTCHIVNSLEDECLELLLVDLKDIDTKYFDIIQYRIETLVGKIKEHATEPSRDALIDCCIDIKSYDEAISKLEEIYQEIDTMEYYMEYYKSLYEELLSKQ